MPDVRESILARLLDVAKAVPGVSYVYRNRAGISEASRPAIIVLDADEAVEEMTENPNGRPNTLPQIVTMTPEVFLLVSTSAADIGADLNMLRRRIVRRVLTDATLGSLLGPHGSITYGGCGTALAVGRSMEGEMAVSFAFRYVLKPMELED